MSDGMTRNLPHITAPPLNITWFHTVKQTSGHVELCWCIMIITICIDSCLNRIYVLCNYFFSPSPVVPVPFLCAQGLGSSRWWLVSLESLGHLQPWLRHRRPLPDTTMWWSRVGKKKIINNVPVKNLGIGHKLNFCYSSICNRSGAFLFLCHFWPFQPLGLSGWRGIAVANICPSIRPSVKFATQ